MFVDGEQLDYFVTEFSFKPNEDIKAEDTGNGVVRIAWEELQNSGTITMTIDDVPADQLDRVLDVFLETKAYRWLSFRGRRYRVNGFTPTYFPQQNPRYFTIQVTCVAYRPHKSIPPVPGTEIFPIMDIRRHGALSVHDRILHVEGFKSWVVVFHTSGLIAFNTRTGVIHRATDNISRAGLASPGDHQDSSGVLAFYGWNDPVSGNNPPPPPLAGTPIPARGQNHYVAYGTQREGQETLSFRIFNETSGWGRAEPLNIPFDLSSMRLGGDTLRYIQGNYLHTWRWNKTATAEPLPHHSLRINPVGSPLFLTGEPDPIDDSVSSVPDDALGVALSGTDKALVFKPEGVIVYTAELQGVNQVKLLDPVRIINPAGDEVDQNLHPTEDMERFGIFGSPGIPEGFWVQSATKTYYEPYMHSDATATPAIATIIPGENMFKDEWVADSIDVETRFGLSGTRLTPRPADNALLNLDELLNKPVIYLKPGQADAVGVIQTRPINVYASTKLEDDTTAPDYQSYGSCFWYEAFVPPGTSIIPHVRISTKSSPGTWSAVPVEVVGVGMQNSLIYKADPIPGLQNGADTEGKQIEFRLQVMAEDTDVATPELYFIAWAISGKFSRYVFKDTDEDGELEVPIEYRQAALKSAYAEASTEWGNLRGVYFDGFSYFAYTDLHVYQTFPLL